MTDWGQGEYERTAALLEPAAAVAVDALAPAAGQRVLDVGCGTGNAALLGARAGAAVAGVDPAPRLLEVARSRVPDGEFVEGRAEELPFDDDAFDAAVSVFGVIFADAEPAAGELLRVVRPDGRVVVTTWVASGPIHETGGVMSAALGRPPQPVRWSDPEVLRQLFAAAADVQIDVHEIPFRAASVDDYLEQQATSHPMWLAAAPALQARGVHDETMARIREIFAAANEDPSAFQTTSRYHVVRVTV